ncbi:hypothetical protein [Salmonella enterica]|nr:hypothetical protein [Salmonella enterica]WGI49598.1 hypothetical protein QBX66_24415 [Salmonella enterica subsp. diarizonae serovar 48:i:z]
MKIALFPGADLAVHEYATLITDLVFAVIPTGSQKLRCDVH